jgi:4-hydroxybutyrate CoA-transferase
MGKTKFCSAEEAVSVVQSGQRIFLTGNCSVPEALIAALVKRAELLNDVEILQVLTLGCCEYVRPELEGHLRVNSLFISEDIRGAVREGRADFTPVFLSEISALYRTQLPIDIAFIHVTPPDEHGFCSYGVEVGVTKAAAEAARIVIAEVNPQMPRTLGDSFIHISKIDYAVEVNRPLHEVRKGEANDVQQAIARNVASLIADGSTIQTGIGGIPDAVLSYLTDRRDLGIHTELFSDGVIDLVERGVITNAAKTLHPGKMVAGFVIGTQRLYDFVNDNPMVELHPTEYVNNPFRIAQNNQMVAINSALEIDLTGQVCADSMGHQFYSGVGGQVDFVRGAAASQGGKPIIALPSTAKKDTLSRIVWELQPGAGVVTTRNDVHYVVTEYGIAYLHGKSIRQRVRALIDIAHPQFRAELEAKACEFHYLPHAYSGGGLALPT